MGAPTSAIHAEIFLQFLEQWYIAHSYMAKIIGHFRYVDDIICNENLTDINHEQQEFNNMQPNMQLSV
jgi:hypothetical protein